MQTFSVLTAFPTEPLDVSNDDFILWEQGGAGTGAFVGFKDGYLRIRAGTGGSSISVPGTSTSNMAVLDVPYSDLVAGGYTSGKLHDLRWEMKIGGGGEPGRVRMWVDDNLLGESNTTGGNLSGNAWSGGDAGGFGRKEGIVSVLVSPRTHGLLKSVLPYSTTTALVLWSILAMSPLKKESPGRSSLQVPRLTKSREG